ncbi:hypothetical protein [Pseudonocardia phyllosphaerae]|uniref:hypothetical protein n=1 Tax=Pseudonocardia phyllosphaerae TaxID=3390502 RepID=UPI00397B44C6
MIICIESDGCVVTDADTLTDLRVLSSITGASSLDEVARAVGIGTAGEGHVFADVERLRALAKESATLEDWDEQFDGMIGYARARGWLSEDGRAVRAHVDRSA